jgi:TRAP-type C4-dicarboxylate transport system permease small subunit
MWRSLRMGPRSNRTRSFHRCIFEIFFEFPIFLAFAFFASGYVECDNDHIRIDVITAKLNLKVRKVLFIIGNLFCAALCVLFILGGFRMVQQALRIGELSPMLVFPLAPIKMLFVAGFFLWALALVAGVFKAISNKI